MIPLDWMCAVSCGFPGEPSLAYVPITKQHSDVASYMVVETSTRLYLSQKISCTSNRNVSSKPQLDSTHTNTVGPSTWM